MQHIIDMILELAKEQIGYFYRGDPAVHDFDILDLTLDAAWHDLDLSALVPTDARCVNLIINIRAAAVGHEIKFRQKGQVNGINGLVLWTQVAGIRLGGIFPINCNADQVIEYKAQAGLWTLIKISVSGWWAR